MRNAKQTRYTTQIENKCKKTQFSADIEDLARQWCELVLGQIQKTNNDLPLVPMGVVGRKILI